MYTKNMKKVLLLFFIAIIVYGGYYYWQNFRGASPAFTNPSKNIVEMFDNSQNEPLSPGQNQTKFPLTIPDGFTLSIFAEDSGKARVLQEDPMGTFVVSDIGRGQILTLPDKKIVTSGLNQPHGFLFDKCNSESCVLYVAEVSALWKYNYNIHTKQATDKQKVTSLPAGGRHFTRYLLKDPTNPNRLLISIGSTCDVCVEKNPANGSVQSFDLITKELKPYATGLRNSVFLTQRPETTEVWGTEMGRDFLGDELPPDEINIFVEGKNYGWPICYGNNIHDDQFDKKTYIRAPCTPDQTEPSHIDLPAHSAPLGLTFIPENSDWPTEYWENLLVAYHGSWNRSEPTGYKIVRIVLDNQGNKVSEQDFITGWLDGNSSLGRPVDLFATKGGKLYISDDKAGVVYILKKM